MRKLLLLAAVAAFISLPLVGSAQTARAGKAGQIIVNAGAPADGTNEIQTLTFGASTTTGNFKLSFDGNTTGNIAWSATNGTLVSNIDAALEALDNIGTSGVTTAVDTMTAGIGTITVTFTGNNAKKNVNLITVNTQTTGGTLSIATTTAGVDATGRGSAKGTLLIDSSTPDLYINDGTGLAPTWTKVSP